MARSEGLDELDLKLVHALNLDGRASFSTIARVVGVSDQTIARRYAHLRSANTIHVVGRTNPHSVPPPATAGWGPQMRGGLPDGGSGESSWMNAFPGAPRVLRR